MGRRAIALAAFDIAQKIMFALIARGVLSPQDAVRRINACSGAEGQDPRMDKLGKSEHEQASHILRKVAKNLQDCSPHSI
jgi:DUF1009 family protein